MGRNSAPRATVMLGQPPLGGVGAVGQGGVKFIHRLENGDGGGPAIRVAHVDGLLVQQATQPEKGVPGQDRPVMGAGGVGGAC